MKYIGCILSLFVALSSQAAVPAKKAVAPTRSASKILTGQGASFGGIAGSGFTLMDLRRTADAKKKVERLVLDIGDIQGANLRGLPGYYYAELKKSPSQLVIDFAQMPNSKINQAQIQSRLKNSLAVRSSELSMDPIDNSLNLTLDLKKNTKVRVYQVAGKKATSKVVIDLIAE